jgi:peptidoglycan/LPS O-acetylase OafA/YrhL
MKRSLDGLRTLAALSVVGYHAWLYTRPRVTAGTRESLGDYAAHELRLGLVLFFVLSGYLLHAPWVRRALTGRPTLPTWAYAVRRVARIIPAYWLAVAGSIALLWGLDATPGVRLPEAGHLWLFAVLGQNFTRDTLLTLDPPLWTLAIEVQFYVAVPLLGWLALRCGPTRARQAIVPVAVLLAGLAWNWGIAGRDASLTLTKLLPAMAPYFAAGMLAAVIVDGRTVSQAAARWAMALGLAAVLGDAVWAAERASRGSHDVVLRVARDLPAAAGFAAMIAALASAEREPRLLTWRPLVLAGTMSYGIYLWHVPLMLWLRGHDLLPSSAWEAFPLALTAGLAVATVSWIAVERPAQRWARLATGCTPGRATPPGLTPLAAIDSARGDVRPQPEARPAAGAPAALADALERRGRE